MQSLKGESFILFTDALKSEASRKNYVKALKPFCEFAGMDTDTLADLGRNDADKA